MADKLKELLGLLEERLVQHDESRKEVQNKLQEISAQELGDADLLEEKINEEVRKDFDPRAARISSIIDKIANENTNFDGLIKEAQEELSTEYKYEIQHSKYENKFVDSYKLSIIPVTKEQQFDFASIDDIPQKVQSVTTHLNEHLDKLHDSMMAAQDEMRGICVKRASQVGEKKTRINEELEHFFSKEDSRIQEVVKLVKESIDDTNKGPEEIMALTCRANSALIKSQFYALGEADSFDWIYLTVLNEVSLKFINFDERKPIISSLSFTEKGELSLSFSFFNEFETDTLNGTALEMKVVIELWNKDHKGASRSLTKEFTFGSDESISFKDMLSASTTYCLKMRVVHQEMTTQWSDETELTTPEFRDLCVWKECPDYVHEKKKYDVDEKNPRIVRNTDRLGCRTIIGNTLLPLNKVTSWNIKILESCNNDGSGIFIGVTPSDINQNRDDNYNECGWYFGCYSSTLCSGPPHNYNKKEYGPREEDGEYVHTGDIVGVVMDTSKGELSFVLNGMNLGVAYEGIPLDKPLVPCVLLKYYGDSVELCVDGVKECTVDPSIPAPSKITANGTAWDSISLSWKSVRRASFYQIEVDGALMSVSKKTNFTKGSLLPKVEHTFRVRAVKGAFLGAWSDVVKEKTVEILPEFGECTWKKCPSGMEKGMRYSVDASNPRIVEIIELKTLFGGNVKVKCASIIGNAPLPINKVTLWSIKMLKSSDNGGRFFIGVAPFDIDQYEKWNREKCGWYFDCYYSQLWSGPPHNYRMKKYGEWKGWRNYVYAGNTVGVVMDTTKGELSFIVKDVNFGVAFEGIPLDKPLMPCMILWSSGISVELVL